MSHIPQPNDEQECRQDTLRRVISWPVVLEERIAALLRESDPGELKPAEQALLDALLNDMPEE